MTLRPFANRHPHLGEQVYVDETALIVGDVSIGDESSVWPYCVIRGDVNSIAIGKQTNVQDHSVLHVTHDSSRHPGGYALTIGDRVTIGHRVTLHGCTVEDECLIGMSATVMDGVIIERHTLLGAGSLVPPNKTLEGGYLWMGTPARRVRPLTEAEIANLQYSAKHYVRLKEQYQI